MVNRTDNVIDEVKLISWYSFCDRCQWWKYIAIPDRYPCQPYVVSDVFTATITDVFYIALPIPIYGLVRYIMLHDSYMYILLLLICVIPIRPRTLVDWIIGFIFMYSLCAVKLSLEQTPIGVITGSQLCLQLTVPTTHAKAFQSQLQWPLKLLLV